MPVFIPKIIENSGSGNYNISTHGCFCSFCCIVSYTNLHYPKICDNVKVNEMIKFLYKIFNGRSVREIFEAPSKYTMIQYGGESNILTYRSALNEIKNKMKKLEYN